MRVRSIKLRTTLRGMVLTGILAAAGIAGIAPAEAAAPGVTYLCSSSDYSCLAASGYTGGSVWGSWGPGHNCVSYAAFRLAQAGIARPWPDRLGSGWEWDDKARAAGVPVDHNPAVGAIAQWDNYGAGHVGYVEQVTATFIDVSEDNFSSSGSGTSTVRRIDRSSQMFADASFLHIRDVQTDRVAVAAIGEGSVVSYRGDVFTIAGGAPVYVSTWDAVGGPRATRQLTDAEFAGLRPFPADGTLLMGAQTGKVYQVVGGAPLYLSTFDVVGGPRPSTVVDQASLDHAGGSGVWRFLAGRPANGTTVVSHRRGEVYRYVGGAPVYVSTFAAIGGPQPLLAVDQGAVDLAGSPGPWSTLSQRPDDGTLLHGGQTGRVYIIRGGHPVYVSAWSEIGGPRPATDVDQSAIDHAGQAGVWSHLA